MSIDPLAALRPDSGDAGPDPQPRPGARCRSAAHPGRIEVNARRAAVSTPGLVVL